jgi:predicted TIM-barrel fold metal-dependent hydrolase
MAIEKAADCHFHIFGDARYPIDARSVYSPARNQMGTVEELLAVFDAHGITHGLAVGAGPYGPDNRCLLDGIAFARGRLKGIALVENEVSERELARLADGGVVGIRINPLNHGIGALLSAESAGLLALVKSMDWFVQLQVEHDQFADCGPILRRAGVRVLVDHFGRPNCARGIDQPGFRALLEFGRASDAVVKLSGPFRTSNASPHYRDVDPFIHAAIDAFTLDRCIWGSDWPWVRLDNRVDYGPVLACLTRWLPDEAQRRKVLWDTPARLFGFR